MRLKSELHRIIGICAGVVFLVIGLVAFLQVRRFQRIEYVEAQGKALGRVLALASTKFLEGARPREELDDLLDKIVRSPQAGEAVQVVSVVVFDEQLQQIAQVGATSREHDPSEPHVQRAYRAKLPGEVVSQPGAVFNRYDKQGTEIVEFALPLINDEGEHRGVIVFSLSREGARTSASRTIGTILLGAALGVLFLWFVLYKVLKIRILTPILLLSEGIKRVRAGDLSARVEIYRRDEIGTLVESFNDLIAILVERDSLQARLEEANRLAEAHRRLNEAHRQLKEAQEKLILTEKHASLGRLVHGLNHELNNPLSAAQNMIPPLKASITSLKESLRAGTGEAALPHESEEKVEAQPEDGEKPPVPPPSGSSEQKALPEGHPEAGLEELPEDIRETLEDATQAAEVIARSVLRAINIVRDLGEFSRLTTADLKWVELRAILDEAVAACERELGPDGRITVSVDLPEVEGEALRLKAFPSLLTQLFVNLLTNSSQAIEGQGRVRIVAKLVGEGRVRVEVEDSGGGIPKENLPKIFEPFFTTKAPGEGTGLGLSICLGVVEKHGGSLEAKKRRRGALFSIELPLEPVVEESDPLTSGSTSILSSSTSTMA